MRPVVAVFTILLAWKEAAASCSNFVSASKLLYTQSAEPHRISEILQCTPGSGSSCKLHDAGHVKVHGFVNISGIPQEDVNSIFETVQMGTRVEAFPPVACASFGGDTYTVPKGQTGFATFTPKLVCVKGVLDSCSHGPVRSKTHINACAPFLLGNMHDLNSADGELELVLTNEEPNTNNPALEVNCKRIGKSANTGDAGSQLSEARRSLFSISICFVIAIGMQYLV